MKAGSTVFYNGEPWQFVKHSDDRTTIRRTGQRVTVHRMDVIVPCRLERASLGSGVICAECGDDCECVVCIA